MPPLCREALAGREMPHPTTTKGSAYAPHTTGEIAHERHYPPNH
jgi:hypothetical protein